MGGGGLAPLSRRQYCAPLNKSQMEQRVFFHLAALKAKQPRATWGGGCTAAQDSLIGAAVGSGLVWLVMLHVNVIFTEISTRRVPM